MYTHTQFYIHLCTFHYHSVAKSRQTLPPYGCITPGFATFYYIPGFSQIHIQRVGNAIELFHPLPSPPPSAFNFSQCQGLFQSVGSSHQETKVLELQHKSYQ